MILFVKNEKSVEMSNIGVVKYKNVGSIDLKDLKQIDITDIVNGGSRIQVYPHDDRTYCLLFVDVNYNYILTRVIIDSDKKKHFAIKDVYYWYPILSNLSIQKAQKQIFYYTLSFI